MSDLLVRVEALRSLEALLRSGHSMRSALIGWHRELPEVHRPAFESFSKRLTLGSEIDVAMSSLGGFFGDDLPQVGLLTSLGSELGGDSASMIDGLARAIEARASWQETGRSSGAGALLSGRLVAALPLAFLPLTPAARAPLLDGPGCLLLLTGLSLAAIGMRWIDKTIPRPPQRDDPFASLADITATMLEAGIALPVCLERYTTRAVDGELGDAMGRMARRVRLGATWAVAMRMEPEAGFDEMGSVLERAHARGIPMAASLREFAGRRRSNMEAAFEARIRKAPVMMVVPLVLCVLPSFCLLALAPFLRGLTLGG